MIRAIVTDIEGTTTALSFVKEVLFPYARAHLADFVMRHKNEAAVADLLEDARVLLAQQQDINKTEIDVTALISGMECWIDEDRKLTPLKALQGMIWEAGYRQGDFHGHIYADAEQALRTWHGQGIELYVYSSGSVYAQKLLFAHTVYGDLTDLFSGYFDTTTGAKQQVESYEKIIQQLRRKGSEILFLSDIPAELNAAQQAGMQTCCLVREGHLHEGISHRQVEDFSWISLDEI